MPLRRGSLYATLANSFTIRRNLPFTILERDTLPGDVRLIRFSLQGVSAMALRWQGSMSVGVVEFDRDHQHMLGLVQKMVAALAEGAEGRARELINSLLVFAADHAARETAFLRRIGYPGVDHIAAVQRDALSRIAALNKATPEEAGEQIAALEDNFVAYLLRADINYKSFVEATGLSDTGRRS
jgi:hemerythrin